MLVPKIIRKHYYYLSDNERKLNHNYFDTRINECYYIFNNTMLYLNALKYLQFHHCGIGQYHSKSFAVGYGSFENAKVDIFIRK